MNDYERGFQLGQSLVAARAEGMNPDIRWDLADEARGPGDFKEFMRGLNDALDPCSR